MTNYTMASIPGWENLPLDTARAPDVDRRIDELVRQALPDHLPRDSAEPFRHELRRHFARLVDEARSVGASLLCLPTQRMGDIAVPASYTVAEWSDTEEGMSPEAFLSELARRSDTTATVVEVDGQPALREDGVHAADPVSQPLAIQAARRISYTVLAPEQQHRWVLFTFSTLGDGDPEGQLADVLVQLFDAQMTTLRWHA